MQYILNLFRSLGEVLLLLPMALGHLFRELFDILSAFGLLLGAYLSRYYGELLFTLTPFLLAFAAWLLVKLLDTVREKRNGGALAHTDRRPLLSLLLRVATALFFLALLLTLLSCRDDLAAIAAGIRDREIWVGYLAVITLAVALVSAAIRRIKRLLARKTKPVLPFSVILATGLFLSAWILFTEIYYSGGTADTSITYGDGWLALLAGLQHAMRLFVVDGDYLSLMGYVESFDTDVRLFYVYYSAILYALAPVTTFSLVLSLVKNFFASVRYRLRTALAMMLGRVLREPRRLTVHVFSELNEKTVALASSIVSEKRTGVHPLLRPFVAFLDLLFAPTIVFTDVTDQREEESLDLIGAARGMRAILFRKDLESIRFKRAGAFAHVYFYLISENEPEKIRHAAHVVKTYNSKNTRLYLFSDSTECKCFLKSYTKRERDAMELEIIHVNDVRSLIYYNLSENGIRLFERAHVGASGLREINAVVAGFGRYGKEMLRALLWYCQLPGYMLNLTVIDRDPDLHSRFTVLFPELEPDVRHEDANDMRYSVRTVTCEIGTEEFYAALPRDLSYVFVSLGTDEENLSAALDIRTHLYGAGERETYIDTVVYDSYVKTRLTESARTHVGDGTQMEEYGIHLIGDIESFYAKSSSLYSKSTVINSDLVEDGFRIHNRWENAVGTAAKNNYFMDDYCFFSSIAKALHTRLRRQILTYPFYLPRSDGGASLRADEITEATGRIAALSPYASERFRFPSVHAAAVSSKRLLRRVSSLASYSDPYAVLEDYTAFSAEALRAAVVLHHLRLAKGDPDRCREMLSGKVLKCKGLTDGTASLRSREEISELAGHFDGVLRVLTEDARAREQDAARRGLITEESVRSGVFEGLLGGSPILALLEGLTYEPTERPHGAPALPLMTPSELRFIGSLPALREAVFPQILGRGTRAAWDPAKESSCYLKLVECTQDLDHLLRFAMKTDLSASVIHTVIALYRCENALVSDPAVLKEAATFLLRRAEGYRAEYAEKGQKYSDLLRRRIDADSVSEEMHFWAENYAVPTLSCEEYAELLTRFRTSLSYGEARSLRFLYGFAVDEAAKGGLSLGATSREDAIRLLDGLLVSPPQRTAGDSAEDVRETVDRLVRETDGLFFTIPEFTAVADTAARVEHIRWLAYMRAEGYRYDPVKNTQFRLHFDLVAADKLSPSEKIKDI